MMDDLDEDDHRWSQRHDAGTKRTGRRAEIWMDGWMDSWIYLLPNPQAESVFKACSAFAFELN